MPIAKSVFFLPFIFILTLSCASKKKISGINREYSNEEILAALEDHNHDFTWFHGKATAQVKTSTTSQTVSMVLRMQKDSAVWMQVKKFEIEAARLLITPLEYTIINRLESTYETSSLNKIRKMAGFPFEFHDIQQWLFGNIILPGKDTSEIIRGEDKIMVLFPSGNWVVSYVMNRDDLKVRRAEIKDENGRVLTIDYDDYKKLKNGMSLPHSRTIYFPDKPGETGMLKMEFSEMLINIPKELKFVIPSHYREFEY